MLPEPPHPTTRDQPERAAPATVRDQPARVALRGVLDRLGVVATHRDAGRRSAAAHDWSTTILPVVTGVPGGPRP